MVDDLARGEGGGVSRKRASSGVGRTGFGRDGDPTWCRARAEARARACRSEEAPGGFRAVSRSSALSHGRVRGGAPAGAWLPVGIDEPYQHYQFAGRADVVAWNPDRAALLHLENRTRFPDFQHAAGSFNSKRAYLGDSLAKRLGVRQWRSETHVVVALWSAEVLHSLRLHPESFRSLCPDPPDDFAAWWAGQAPAAGVTSSLVLLDPLARGRQRVFVGLDDAIASAKPRHRGYVDVVSKMTEAS